MNLNAITLFVITYGTSDYGNRFVVREHRGLVANRLPLAVCGSLEEARGAIEEHRPSLVRVDRCAWDDVVIVETWTTAEGAAVLREVQRVGAFFE